MQTGKLSRDLLKEKHVDFYYDAVWVKHLIKAVQKLGTGVGALIYKELGMVIFFYKDTIFYKVMMNDLNENLIPIEMHQKRAGAVLRSLKEGKIATHILGQAQQNFKSLNTDNAIKK